MVVICTLPVDHITPNMIDKLFSEKISEKPGTTSESVVHLTIEREKFFMALSKSDREEAVPFAMALTFERVKILQKRVLKQELRISELQDQLSITATSRTQILGRLNKVREALEQ